MEARNDGRTHIVRLDRGEPVIASLQRYIGDKGIQGGSVIGIGSIEATELGFFVPGERRYDRRAFPEPLELLSFAGTISRLDGAPFIHAHVTLGGHDYGVVGGHLFEAKVAVTGEFAIHEADAASSRVLDDDTGLKLMRFG
ncbi:MAG: DNA-binding protein [Myxococcota bacterium]|nr:DNA-binding protein [Myxococcota bacterium]